MKKIIFLFSLLFFLTTAYAGEFIPFARGTLVNNSHYDTYDIQFGGDYGTYSRLYFSGIYGGQFSVDKWSEEFSIYDDNPSFISVVNMQTNQLLCYLGFKPTKNYQALNFLGSYYVDGSDVNCTVTGDHNNFVLTISNKS